MLKEMIIIRKLLVTISIVLLLYSLNLLAVIFIPFTFGLFLALLFSPFMRWIKNRKIPTIIGILGILVFTGIIFTGTYKITKLAGTELRQIDDDFIKNTEIQLNEIAKQIIGFLNISPKEGETELSAFFNSEKVSANLYQNLGNGINMIKNFLTTFLMALFFMILFLTGTSNIRKAIESVAFKESQNPVLIYKQIEKNIFVFISVKIFMSLLTGLVVGITCALFGVSFPVFWGVVGFLLNFIQLVGSVVVVLALSIFALTELHFTGSFLIFILLIVGLQVLIGGVLEPILLGKTFSINIIAILIMLAVWGLVWGIPGLVLAVPITVLLKSILEKSPKTNFFAKLMS